MTEMTQEELLLVGAVAQSLENLTKAAEWADQLRANRDKAINDLRLVGWSMADVAALSGLSQPMIQKIGERGGIKSVRRATKP